MRIARDIALFLTGLAAGLLIMANIVTHNHHLTPHCLTEDSCTAQYYSGAWHITEVKP